ncbi:N-acetyl-gamma-glutamyl-phosphate reductase [Fictibacillus phosphorivorans]|uniref:N-acetyl-gamma-glutamyl-phosphate reductase n=1 Tax=Fictibacillus phosphorivorans TaxID=1221500 RepID=UPI00203C03B9|nr:N-acetyl-gamma-glutamyl-phosphate reductase [Fictibacillus phosphorivorans]MCM3718780.1 N-acetyl-gamma-glutamyl-phosphate reductase [Fictibacillus phosphorivorans]MCM3776403.1 N-acetyl-gamma-glutamyl-phosphate reductase [Fictibacillus phosphorivorans]
MRAGIIGVTGYGGLELFRLLTAHQEINELFLYSSSKQGQLLSDEAPHLFEMNQEKLRSFEQLETDELDVLFCSAPSGVSSELLPPHLEGKMKVIDLAGDFRLKEADVYRKWYGKEPPNATFVDNAVYGLTEWNENKIKEANLIANPGCYPTATLLGILPLVKTNVINPKSLIIDAKSGLSGAGASPNKASHFTKVNDSLSVYKMNKHQHIPEIEQTLKTFAETEVNITFTTHLVPMTRGIMATIYAELTEDIQPHTVSEIFNEFYQSKPFVRVFKEKTDLFTKQVYGSNYCDLTFALDERTNRITVISVIDNLIKGAAGQAVQNMNIMFGLNETEGLQQSPLFP